MTEPITLSLLITLLGMGIVFGAIILLWGLMAALTGLLAEKQAPALPEPAPLVDSASDDKAHAAAIAVVVALAEQELSTARPLAAPPTALVSAWQLGMRTRQMYQKSERAKMERQHPTNPLRGAKK